MQTLRSSSSIALYRLTRSTSSATPWFVDPSFTPRAPPPDIRRTATPVLPEDAPSIVKCLYSKLVESPHLDSSTLAVGPAVPPPPGPPLPRIMAHGRRRRGGTYAGESAYDTAGSGLWDWVVTAQVKEGTESRGSIESVVRLVRKTVLSHTPTVPLAPKSRRKNGTEWVMIDGGTFAVHILSKAAREKYFTQ